MKKIEFLSFGHWSAAPGSRTHSAADLIADGRLQLGISRGSPEQVIDGWHHFGYAPADGETGEPLRVQQRRQIDAYRKAWAEAGHDREPRVSVSRSIMPITTDQDRAYFGRDRNSADQFGNIDANTRAVFGRSYSGEPDKLVEQLAGDEAIGAADTLLLTIPSQLGVDYNAHLLESILTDVAPALGWR